METLSEIVAQMRGRGEDGRMDRRLWLDYADRIEAIDSADAWRSLYTPGNAAAMREALVAALPIMRNCPFAYYNTTDVDAVVAVMERALSAPARQCDVGTAEEQYRRWVHFCEQRLHRCDNCPCNRPEGGCTFMFENMPYAAAEGAGK